MFQPSKSFHKPVLLLLIAALIPAGTVLFTGTAEAHLAPNIPVDCDADLLTVTTNVRNGCCLRGDYLRWNYLEYQCVRDSYGYRWVAVSEWCGWSLCAGIEPQG